MFSSLSFLPALQHRGRCLLGAALLLAPWLAGCGGSSADGRLGLSGTVHFQGQPLAQGTIEFSASDGSQQTGGVIEQGKFSIPAAQGLKPGTYTVRISSIEEAGGGAAVEAPGPESMQAASKERIPADYNSASQQTVEVTADGPNQYAFKIP